MKIFSRLSIALLALTIFFFVGKALYTHQKNNQEQLISQLRSQIKQELKAEVKEEVLLEVKQDIHSLAAKEVKEQFDQLVSQRKDSQSDKLAQSKANSQETIEEAVRRVVKEIFSRSDFQDAISDRELDQYVAGKGIEPELEVNPGVKKSPQQPEMFLAEGSTKTISTKQAKAKTKSSDKLEDTKEISKSAESLQRTLQQRGSILLPKGTLQFEPSVTWAHFSSNRINIQGFSILPVLVIGDIDVEKVNRDLFINTYSFKYGLLNNFQTEFKLPFRGEYDRTNLTSTSSETTRNAIGIGDIEFGVSRQIAWEHGAMPDLVAAFSLKTPSGREPYNNEVALGTGHWAARGSLIAAKSSDPAVIFGSLSYTYNFERTGIENFGDIRPGATVGYSVGTAIALSYQTAISFSFDNSVTFKLNRNGNDVPGSFSNVANFKTGLNWAIDENHSVDFGVSMGLTTDSPDLSVELRFPMTF